MQCTQFSQSIVTQFSQFSLLHLPTLYKVRGLTCQEIDVAGCAALLCPGDFGEASYAALPLQTDQQAVQHR